ncbi:MAG: hypothetical protein KDB23_13120 [Planctomycetales bacterium]|nr:hypothetical protein [Planctomycetales bacterium]
MKRAIRVILMIVAGATVASFVAFGWLLYDASRAMRPATYLQWLDASRSVYANVDSISESDLERHAYLYRENKFVDAVPDATRLPPTADASGHVPAFKLGNDIFILTWKWVNRSAGLAISDSQDFKSRVESISYCFRVHHLSGNIYEWVLDLETPYPVDDAG